MTTVIYHYIDYFSSAWTLPDLMVDGNTETYAYAPAAFKEQMNSTNTCPGDDLGTITKIEMRAMAYSDPIIDTIFLIPVYELGRGGNIFSINQDGSGIYSEWFDVTVHANAPDPWTWADVVDLWVDMVSGTNVDDTFYCSIVEIRVTYALPPAFSDSGLRIWDGNDYIKVGTRDTPIADDRLMLWNGSEYVRIALVDPGHANASRVYLCVGNQYKCLVKV